jgi:hypothetical protein
MLRPLLLIGVFSALCLTSAVHADDGEGALTTSDLAQFLHVHWWYLKLPGTAAAGSSVAVQWIASDGSGITGSSATMTNTSLVAGAVVKIFLQDAPGGPAVTISTPGGKLETTFPAISFQGATLGGLPDGASANSGDVLLKVVHRAADGSLVLPPGNMLNAGDVGMRVVIRPPAK